MIVIKESDEERILKDLVFVPSSYTDYKEIDKNLIRIRDTKTGKIFEIKVTEKKDKKVIQSINKNLANEKRKRP